VDFGWIHVETIKKLCGSVELVEDWYWLNDTSKMILQEGAVINLTMSGAG
jgi:hypothetical protein